MAYPYTPHNEFSEYIGDEPCWGTVADSMRLVKTKVGKALELGAHCESPIEVQLGAQLLIHPPFSNGLAQLLPQFKLDRYRFDFAVRLHTEAFPRVFIECDGAEFHSTPEQLENDKRKDEAIRKRGSTILRFTGRQIFRDAASCAEQIREALAK